MRWTGGTRRRSCRGGCRPLEEEEEEKCGIRTPVRVTPASAGPVRRGLRSYRSDTARRRTREDTRRRPAGRTTPR